MMKRYSTLLLFTVVLSLLLSACSKPHEFSGTVFDDTVAAFDFTGTNYDGSTFQLSEHRDKVVLLFFGYTFCPDVCPFTLADLNMLYDQLGEQAEDLTVVFVTVDPERDTLEKLATYVPAFNPAFYGVRLEGEMYEAVKTTYGVYVENRPVEGSQVPGGYFVDHTGIIYLIDKAGNLSEVFPPNSDADFMQADVAYWLSRRS
jgi:protein SCO1/2